ncbi:MAG TPA: FixH family protein [Steroidobacteraceae bacterium]|nr:FixH family protein [Steroidobacteraceae bacterium]
MNRSGINSGVLLAIGLPLFAICASVGVAIVAFTRGDPTLPDDYHWEGMQLDRDFADSRRAEQLDVRAGLRAVLATGSCEVSLHLKGPAPAALQLKLVHATRPDLDRAVKLVPDASGYSGYCGQIPQGHWHLELGDEAGSWRVRQDVTGPMDNVSIDARPRGG